MTSDWLIDLHSANFSNSLQQKITKLESMNFPRFPSFSVPNPWLESTLQSQVNVGKITDEDFPELGYSVQLRRTHYTEMYGDWLADLALP